MDEFYSYLERRMRPNSVKAYRKAFGAYVAWLNGEDPSANNAQEYLDHLETSGRKPNGICLVANSIRRYFKWKTGNDIHLDHPSPHIGEPVYLSKEQFDNLIKACHTPLEKALIYGVYDTACRISEFLNIRKKDIDWEHGLITVTRKGGRIAQVNISEKAMSVLDSFLSIRNSKSERVFMDMTYNDAWSLFKEIGKRVGLNIHPHMLRHTRAIHMLENKAQINVVQGHLGHRNIGTTMDIYGRFRPIDLKEKIPTW